MQLSACSMEIRSSVEPMRTRRIVVLIMPRLDAAEWLNSLTVSSQVHLFEGGGIVSECSGVSCCNCHCRSSGPGEVCCRNWPHSTAGRILWLHWIQKVNMETVHWTVLQWWVYKFISMWQFLAEHSSMSGYSVHKIQCKSTYFCLLFWQRRTHREHNTQDFWCDFTEYAMKTVT